MKKTLLFNILTAAVMLLTAYSPVANDTLSAWMGVIAAAITLFLNTTFTQSGTWIAFGWSWAQWSTSIAVIILNIGGLVTSAALVPPSVVNFVMILATVAIQYFGKAYKAQ